MNPTVGVILVNYNGSDFTSDCVSSLLKTDFQNLKIYIIDNGSNDDDFSKINSLSKQTANIKLLKLKKNVGLTKANNIGLKQAIADNCTFLWILNNDTFVKNNAIKLFITAFKKNKLSPEDTILTSIITFDDGLTVWSSGMYDLPLVNFPKSINKKKKLNQLTLSDKDMQSCPQASSCSLFIHQNFCAKHGLMDEDYFIYYDDLDWSRKGKVKVIQQPLVTHRVSATAGNAGSDGFTPFKAYWNGRNAIKFYFKRKLIPWYEKIIFLIFTVWIMAILYIRDTRTLISYWQGIRDGIWKTT